MPLAFDVVPFVRIPSKKVPALRFRRATLPSEPANRFACERSKAASEISVDPAHPLTRGLPEAFVLPEHEVYCEFFDIPPPDELVFRRLVRWVGNKAPPAESQLA